MENESLILVRSRIFTFEDGWSEKRCNCPNHFVYFDNESNYFRERSFDNNSDLQGIKETNLGVFRYEAEAQDAVKKKLLTYYLNNKFFQPEESWGFYVGSNRTLLNEIGPIFGEDLSNRYALARSEVMKRIESKFKDTAIKQAVADKLHDFFFIYESIELFDNYK